MDKSNVKLSVKKAAKSGINMKNNAIPNGDALLLIAVSLEKTVQRQSKFIYFILLALILSLTANMILSDQEPPKDNFFGQTKDGFFTKIQPLSEPIVNNNKMRMWTEECVVNTLQISFSKPIDTLNTNLTKCFGPNGRRDFVKWITDGDSSNTIKYGKREFAANSEIGKIISKKITLEASLRAPGTIKKIDSTATTANGVQVAQWRVTMPIILRSIKGTKGSGINTYDVMVTITRVTDASKDEGVEISSFSIKRGSRA